VDDKAVLDASSTLAYILRETGWENVAPVLGNAYLSTVNASEVISDLLNRNWSLEFTLETLTNLRLNLIPHDFDQAVKVAEIKKSCRAKLPSRGQTALALP
jgi:ribonuclease VapC